MSVRDRERIREHKPTGVPLLAALVQSRPGVVWESRDVSWGSNSEILFSPHKAAGHHKQSRQTCCRLLQTTWYGKMASPWVFGMWGGKAKQLQLRLPRGHLRGEQPSAPLEHISPGWGCCLPAPAPACSRLSLLDSTVHCGLLLSLSSIRPSQAVWRQRDASVSPSSLQTARAHFPNLNRTQKLALHGHGCYF